MDNRILLVSKGSTFMVDALSNGLKDEGIEVIKSGPGINELKNYKTYPGVILFYLGGFLEEITEELVYLKDLCIENDKILCTVGDPVEYQTLIKVIPESLIREHYNRPLDIKQVAEKIKGILSLNDFLAQRKKILLVDDDPTFLGLAKSWLDEQYRVFIVNSGMQAIAFLATNKPDLILLDYEMPVTDGPKVLEMIRTETDMSSIPVIFLTGRGDKESVMKVVSLKPNGYLLKTITKQELLKSVQDFLDSN